MENVIGGKLNYLRMVRGTNNVAYLKLQARYDKLQQLIFIDNETDSKTSYVYVQPYKMVDFISDFSTTITLEITPKKKLIGKCVLAGMDKIIPISKSTQKSLCPDIESKEPGQIVVSEILSNCFVTLCRSKGKNFWLITEFEPKRSKCLSIQNASIDIDKLLEVWDKQGMEEAVSAFQSCLAGINPFEDATADEENGAKSKKEKKNVKTKDRKQTFSPSKELLEPAFFSGFEFVDGEDIPVEFEL